jgi:hypothetical protein
MCLLSLPSATDGDSIGTTEARFHHAQGRTKRECLDKYNSPYVMIHAHATAFLYIMGRNIVPSLQEAA